MDARGFDDPLDLGLRPDLNLVGGFDVAVERSFDAHEAGGDVELHIRFEGHEQAFLGSIKRPAGGFGENLVVGFGGESDHLRLLVFFVWFGLGFGEVEDPEDCEEDHAEGDEEGCVFHEGPYDLLRVLIRWAPARERRVAIDSGSLSSFTVATSQ